MRRKGIHPQLLSPPLYDLQLVSYDTSQVLNIYDVIGQHQSRGKNDDNDIAVILIVNGYIVLITVPLAAFAAHIHYFTLYLFR